MTRLITPEKIILQNNKEITESVIQEIIAEDPSVIGLGDLVLKDVERSQPRAGRLDLLLQDPESNRRYEVELQLGKTDESHIIRTIEYWDIERKRYPQYDHCAVIIAEDITSRFLNVIGLFNGHIPIIAIQMNAFKIHEDIGLVFTTVLDELPLGLVDEDENIREVTDRSYWTKRGSEATVKIADEIMAVISTFSSSYELKYNKFYIGPAEHGRAYNFMVVRPRKNHAQLDIKLPKSEEVDKIIEDNHLDDMGYDKRYNAYRIRLSKGEVQEKKDVITNLLKQAENSFR